MGVLLASCGGFRQPSGHEASQPPVFPDYAETTVPSTIAPLNFGLPEATHIQATFTNASGEKLEAQGKTYVDIPEKKWHQLLAQGGDIRVEVSIWTPEKPDGVSYEPFVIHVSTDKIDPWMAYRLIPPGYEGWDKMGIYERDLSSFEVRPIVLNTQNNSGCVNCHAFCQYSPETFMFHARGAGGGTLIYRNGKMEKVEINKMGPKKNASYNIWHPSGKYIAFSSNSTKQSFYGCSRDKIEVYDMRSDIIVYDVENHNVLTDERFVDSVNWETLPCFSPDGKYLYFSTSHAVHVPMECPKLKFSIVRVPFDEQTGALGQIDTVYSAAQRGGSALMPRISPNGRYMLYTWGEYGAFHVYHKEADFRMMDLQTGEDVDVSPLNSNDVESYHVWSSNSSWVMFASKRMDTRYTRIFISHWDGKQFSKPFLLPQRDPEHNTMLMFSFNIPEFMSAPIDVPKDELSDFFRVDNPPSAQHR